MEKSAIASSKNKKASSAAKSVSLRSKEYRLRKKTYVKQLEVKIEKLEIQNKDLKEIITSMESQPPISADKEKGSESNPKSSSFLNQRKSNNGIKSDLLVKNQLKMHEDYVHDNIYKKIKKSPDEVGYSTLDYAYTNMSELRRDYLKEHFKEILNNVISLENRCLFACLKKTTTSEVKRKFGVKKRHSKYSDK